MKEKLLNLKKVIKEKYQSITKAVGIATFATILGISALNTSDDVKTLDKAIELDVQDENNEIEDGLPNATPTNLEVSEEDSTNDFDNTNQLVKVTENHEHIYNKLSNTSYKVFDNKSHLRFDVYSCECGEEDTIVNIEDCSYKLENYTDKYELLECEFCKELDVRLHMINECVLDKNTMNITYSCLNDYCDYSYVKKYTEDNDNSNDKDNSSNLTTNEDLSNSEHNDNSNDNDNSSNLTTNEDLSNSEHNDKPTNTGGSNTSSQPSNVIDMMAFVDSNTLSFTYDGEEHCPSMLSNLPHGITVKSINGANTDANVSDSGDEEYYICRIEFNAPEGLIVEPINIPYKINKAVVSYGIEYNKTTNMLETVYEGIIDKDIVSKNNYTTTFNTELKNGDYITTEKENIVPEFPSDYGIYKVNSTLEIDQDKAKNYILPTDKATNNILTSDVIYEVKRENTWYNIKMVPKVNGNDITIDVKFADNKVTSEYGLMPAVQFNVYFNSKQIGYDVSNVYQDSDNWERVPFVGNANAMFQHKKDGYIVNGDIFSENDQGAIIRDVITSPVDVLDPTVKEESMCKLNFKLIDPNAKDVIIKIDDIQLGMYSDYYPFEYITDAVAVVINPSNSQKIEIIKTDNDLMDDTGYTQTSYPEDKEAYREALQEYINNGFVIPEPINTYNIENDITTNNIVEDNIKEDIKIETTDVNDTIEESNSEDTEVTDVVIEDSNEDVIEETTDINDVEEDTDKEVVVNEIVEEQSSVETTYDSEPTETSYESEENNEEYVLTLEKPF